MARWIADRRIYLTEEGQATDDPALGRWLLAPEGRELDEATCLRYGLGPHAGNPQPEEADREETKAEETTSRGVGVKTPKASKRSVRSKK